MKGRAKAPPVTALSLRPGALPAISRGRPIEAVAEVVRPNRDRDVERALTIRIELAPAGAASPQAAPRLLPPLTFEASGVDDAPLTAATSNRIRAVHAYAVHASPPPPAGIVIRRRA